MANKANPITSANGTINSLRRARLAAQIDFLARRLTMKAPAINTAVFIALTRLDQGSSAAAAYAAGEQALKTLRRQRLTGTMGQVLPATGK